MTGIIQGTEEWHQLRLGKVTASRVADILAKGKNGAELAGAKNYRAMLAVERITGARNRDSYTNAAMQRGNDLEPLARECYEYYRGVSVEQVAFIDHPTIPMAGASPDGLVGEDGMLEIKCPSMGTHYEYLVAGTPPAQYIPQMNFQMACSGRQWVDFCSYDPDYPDDLQLFIVRHHRDEAAIKEMEEAVVKFLASVDEAIANLERLRK